MTEVVAGAALGFPVADEDCPARVTWPPRAPRGPEKMWCALAPRARPNHSMAVDEHRYKTIPIPSNIVRLLVAALTPNGRPNPE